MRISSVRCAQAWSAKPNNINGLAPKCTSDSPPIATAPSTSTSGGSKVAPQPGKPCWPPPKTPQRPASSTAALTPAAPRRRRLPRPLRRALPPPVPPPESRPRHRLNTPKSQTYAKNSPCHQEASSDRPCHPRACHALSRVLSRAVASQAGSFAPFARYVATLRDRFRPSFSPSSIKAASSRSRAAPSPR